MTMVSTHAKGAMINRGGIEVKLWKNSMPEIIFRNESQKNKTRKTFKAVFLFGDFILTVITVTATRKNVSRIKRISATGGRVVCIEVKF